MKNTLTIWQHGSLIIISFILAAVWFGAGILWERNRQAHLPRVFLRLPEFRVTPSGQDFKTKEKAPAKQILI